MRPSAWRIASLAFGLPLVAGSLNSPLETWAVERLLRFHLLQDALVAEVGPLFVLLGLTPALRDRLSAHGARHLRVCYMLPVWLVAWNGTHAASSSDWTLRNEWPLSIEHAVPVAGWLLLSWPLVSGRLSAPAPIDRADGRLSPAPDESLGGILLDGEQTLVFVVATAWYVWRLLDGSQPEARPLQDS